MEKNLAKEDFLFCFIVAHDKNMKQKKPQIALSPSAQSKTAKMPQKPQQLESSDISRVIEMAWEDRTTFEAIEVRYGLKEKQVIALMRQHMKRSSFEMWRKRVSGRRTKHAHRRRYTEDENRFCSPNKRR